MTGKSVGTFKWLTSYFEPTMAAIRTDWQGNDPIQGYCDYLNHRWQLANSQGADVDRDVAYRSWVEAGFPGFPPGE